MSVPTQRHLTICFLVCILANNGHSQGLFSLASSLGESLLPAFSQVASGFLGGSSGSNLLSSATSAFTGSSGSNPLSSATSAFTGSSGSNPLARASSSVRRASSSRSSNANLIRSAQRNLRLSSKSLRPAQLARDARRSLLPKNPAAAARDFSRTGREVLRASPQILRSVPKTPQGLIEASPIAALSRAHQLSNHPEVKATTCDFARMRGFPCQYYTTTTQDGYVLTMHRIPYGRRGRTGGQRPVAFLQHGLLQSSADWVINFAEDSLGFVLADAGYDVWLGNVRGNTYSRRHVRYSPNSRQFWQFSFDDMARFDIPAMVNTALSYSGAQKLYYVGHSQGATVGIIAFSTFPDWAAQRIRAFFALAPASWLRHTRSPIRLLSHYSNTLTMGLNLVGNGEFAENSALTRLLGTGLCSGSTTELCGNLLLLLVGQGGSDLNRARMPVYLSHSPAGTSVKNIQHFSQLAQNGRFERFDYGTEGNRKAYGSARPPSYQPRRMTVPTALFYGDLDALTDPRDIRYLRQHIRNPIGQGLYGYRNTGHVDFVWGTRVARQLYPQLIRMMKNY